MKIPKFIFTLFITTFTFAQTPGTWKLTGPLLFPVNVSGQINGIGRTCQVKFSPLNSQRMFACTSSGGVYISNDQSHTWNVLGTDVLPRMGCASICVDFTNDSILYLGSGDPNYYYTDLGIWKSTDMGATWNLSNAGIGNRMALEILMDPADHNTLIAATNDGIWKSYDAGVTWTVKKSGGGFTDMIFKPAPGSKVIYACDDSEFWRSLDMGETWTQITNGTAVPGGGNGGGFRIAVSAQDSNVVYVGMIKDEGTIIRSNDGGTSFVTTYHYPARSLTGYDTTGGGQGNYNFDLTCDPNNANSVYLASHCVWHSNDGGVTWTKLTAWYAILHTDMHHIFFNPAGTILFNANDGGIFQSTDGGTMWTPVSDGLGATECYHGAQSQNVRDLVSIGTQDNGELYFYNGTWRTNRGGDWGSKEDFDFFNSNKAYYFASGMWRDIVLNAGDVSYGSPFTASGTTNDLTHTEFNPLVPATGFLAYTNLYRSTNLTAATPSWTTIGTFNEQIQALSSSVANDNILYVVFDNATLKRSDDALSPTPTYTALNAPGNTNVNAGIAAIGNNANAVYISCGSFVYRSADKGVSWTNVTYNLPNIGIIRIIHDTHSTDESVYVCNGRQVFYLNNTMNSWQNYFSGLPSIANIQDMMIYNDGTSASLLRVAYYGRGVWETPLSSFSSQPPAPLFTADQTVICPSNAIQFTDMSHGNPISWNWNFPGGTPSTSTLQNPIIVYNQAGIYSVSLTVTNANGSSSTTQTNYIHVSLIQALPLVEGFEGNIFVPNNWSLKDDRNDNVVWQQNISVGHNSAQSAFFDNYNIDATGARDEIRTPKYNFANLTSAKIKFDVAYARYSAVNSDTLAVLVSTDCGTTFTRIYFKGGVALATSPDLTANIFVPLNSEWRTDSVDLSAFIGQGNVMIAFQNVGYYGQALYLDNINISASSNLVPAAMFAANDTNICEGQTVFFTDISTNVPSAWAWTFAGGTPASSTLQDPSVVYNTAGTYNVSLTVTNSNGNSSFTHNSFIVVNANPTVPTITQNMNILTSSIALNYQWYFNGNLIPNAISQNYNAAQSGNYYVVVSNAAGCTAQSSVLSFTFTGVEEYTDAGSLSVYPNPNNGQFTISLETITNENTLEIIDFTGRIIFSQLINFPGLSKQIIDLGNISGGVYLVTVRNKNGRSVKKIIVN